MRVQIKDVYLAAVHLSCGESVDKEGEHLEINTEVQLVSLLFSCVSRSVFELWCTMPSMKLQQGSEGNKCYSEHFPYKGF